MGVGSPDQFRNGNWGVGPGPRNIVEGSSTYSDSVSSGTTSEEGLRSWDSNGGDRGKTTLSSPPVKQFCVPSGRVYYLWSTLYTRTQTSPQPSRLPFLPLSVGLVSRSKDPIPARSHPSLVSHPPNLVPNTEREWEITPLSGKGRSSSSVGIGVVPRESLHM